MTGLCNAAYLQEVKGIASLLDINVHFPESHDEKRPFLVLNLHEECARKLVSRAVLVRSLFELWAQGNNYHELYSSLRSLPAEFQRKYTNESTSFKFNVDSFGKNVTQKRKVEIIKDVLTHGVNFEGPVTMKNPDNTFHIIEEYRQQPEAPGEEPMQIYFGRWLADGQRSDIQKYSLKKRKFIGNTSMDAGLSLVMANIAGARHGSLILDPFVGSGSLLVSSAHYGAYVMGAEIDHKLLHGIGKSSRSGQKWRARDENIRNNLKQYGLDQYYVDVLAADSSKNMWRKTHGLFDAIVTDPPYGIREGTRKIGNVAGTDGCAEPDASPNVGLKQYHISEVFTDLLNFSARYLVLGGRLVYWYPVYRPEYTEEHIPQHACLTVVSNCEQVLNARVSRRLITMEKLTHAMDEETLNSAAIPVDPFQQETFRDKYFGAEAIAKERSATSVPVSPAEVIGRFHEGVVPITESSSRELLTAKDSSNKTVSGVQCPVSCVRCPEQTQHQAGICLSSRDSKSPQNTFKGQNSRIDQGSSNIQPKQQEISKECDS